MIEATTTCQNCGRPAGPRFCGECGQSLEELNGSALAVFAGLLAGWFSVDGRLLRTLRALVKPGLLTVQYLSGRRVVFLAPFRLYLLASVVLFSSMLGLDAPDASKTNLVIFGTQVTDVPPAVSGGTRTSSTLQFLSSDSWFERRAVERFGPEIEALKERPAQEVMDALFAGLRRFLPTSLILFIPFLALALKLLYFRSRRLYLEHLVFATHLQSALFLLLSVAWVTARIAGVDLLGSALIYGLTGTAFMLVYLPLALRRMYQQSRIITAVKTGLLLYCYARLLGAAITLPALALLW